MRDMLLAARLAVDKAGKAAALVPDQLAAFVERYWAAVRLGLAFHRALPKLAAKTSPRGRKRRPGDNLLQRLKTFETDASAPVSLRGLADRLGIAAAALR